MRLASPLLVPLLVSVPGLEPAVAEHLQPAVGHRYCFTLFTFLSSFIYPLPLPLPIPCRSSSHSASCPWPTPPLGSRVMPLQKLASPLLVAAFRGMPAILVPITLPYPAFQSMFVLLHLLTNNKTGLQTSTCPLTNISLHMLRTGYLRLRSTPLDIPMAVFTPPLPMMPDSPIVLPLLSCRVTNCDDQS